MTGVYKKTKNKTKKASIRQIEVKLSYHHTPATISK